MSVYGSTIPRARDTQGIAQRVARGDDLELERILVPETFRMCMDSLSQYVGDLAYSPEVEQRVQEVLERRFTVDQGNDLFNPPNYAPYDDPEMAAFYGIDTSQVTNLKTRKENYTEQRDRLVKETVREVEPEMKGLWMQMEQFRMESWARHGVADEAPFVHTNPDVTLFRNYSKGWAAIDNAVATSNKTNVIDLHEAEPEFTHPTPHPGWDVDRRGGIWNSLQ
jgi:hypothetical protein